MTTEHLKWQVTLRTYNILSLTAVYYVFRLKRNIALCSIKCNINEEVVLKLCNRFIDFLIPDPNDWRHWGLCELRKESLFFFFFIQKWKMSTSKFLEPKII